MSFRTDLLKVVESIRHIPKNQFDNRPNQLTIRTRTWSGNYVGEGSSSDSDLVLQPIYKIRQISTQEILTSGGSYELGDVSVDHITPYDGTSVGYTPDQLAPSVNAPGKEVIYVVTGTLAGEYTRVYLDRWRTYSYRLVLRRRATTP